MGRDGGAGSGFLIKVCARNVRSRSLSLRRSTILLVGAHALAHDLGVTPTMWA